MSAGWMSDMPGPVPIGPLGWARVVLRGVPSVVVILVGFSALAAMRLVERRVHGVRRPWTPWCTQAVCRVVLRIIGIRHRTRGTRMSAPGAVVANHASWLDIVALNARKRVYFVSKAEVAGWPAIGWLARVTGTVFIERSAREAKAQRKLFEARLSAGHKLLFFPEGTSSDGLRVLPFKSTLFAAFFAPELRGIMHVQPVTVIWRAPAGADPRFYGWWGDMDFGSHLLRVLAAPSQGSVEVVYHAPVGVTEFGDRKALARHCEAAVRSAFPAELVRAGAALSPPSRP